MIVTERQRRWWFATHPEFSTGSSDHGSRGHGGDGDDGKDSGRPSPESVDAWANERLSYETDDVRRTLVELAKFYFGTEFQSKTSAEKEAILREDEDATWEDDEPSNAEGNDWWSQQPADTQAPDEDKPFTYKDVLNWLDGRQKEEVAKAAFIREMMHSGWSRERAEERWQVYKLNESVARGVAGAMTVQSAIAGARAILAGAYRWAVSLGEVGAVGTKGPRLPPRGTPERARIEAARNLGVRRKKAQELQEIQAGGKGSGVWTEKELKEIRQTGRFPLDARWHHDPTVANRPDLAADPKSVQPLRGGPRGHLRDGHGGNYQNPKK